MKLRLLGALGALIAFVLLQPTSAYAAPSAGTPGTAIAVTSARTHVERRINPECVAQLRTIDEHVSMADQWEYCGSTITTVTKPKAQAINHAGTGVQTLTANPNNVWYAEYYQNEVAANGAWKVHHNGLWYFDGNVAWIDSQFGWDASGWHGCTVDYALAFVISQLECGKWGDGDTSMWVSYNVQVSYLFKGFPLTNQINMRINLANNGWMYFYKDR